MKSAKPVSMKSSGTDNPSRYVGGWETYTKPQGIKKSRVPKVKTTEDVGEWNGKHVVWTGGGYRVAVDTPGAATYVTAWTDDNVRVGALSSRTIPGYRDWLSIRDVMVDSKHRGNRIGLRMYQALMQQMDPKYRGLVGYKPDIANKRQVPAIYRRLGGKTDPNNADVILVPRSSHSDLGEANALLPLNDNTLAQARVFLRQKWDERFQERTGKPRPTSDMSGSCKFVSLFVKKVFGGEMQGNHDHQFNVIDGKIIDLNHDAADVAALDHPHHHDPKFWGNPEHRSSMRSCETRVNQWVQEFIKNQQMVEAIFGTDGYLPPEPDDDPVVSDEDAKAIKLSARAPKKVVQASARALSARGKRPRLNPYKLEETVRRPMAGSLTNQYEVVDDQDQTVGTATVNKGVIDQFDFTRGGDEAYRGHIISMMLHQIIGDADRHNANLSVQIAELTGEFKSTMERFGFRLINGSVMQRRAGSIRPTSVQSTPGMVNRDE